jgi:hypothetical protein
VDITPDKPVPLDGHRNLRISKKVESPITATALALESRAGDKGLDQAVIVSCDLVAIRRGIVEKVREKVRPRLPDFDLAKLFLCATHTHNAPVTVEGRYALPESGVMKPAQYVDWMTARVAEAIVESWQKRRPGRVGWGQGQAVVAQNRRAVYADGTAQMYGATNTGAFRGIEGYEDHNLDVLFFWDEQERLLATAINVPCPAQEAEGGLAIHADFWHPVRQTLHQRHGNDLCVLAWTGAERLYPMELHVLRLGDVAVATNDFELYTDYGVQMKARSPAVQTFVIQLAGSGGYLPTERAVRGGGYGAVIQSSRVGPDGGQVLVNRTVRAIEELWPK